MGGCRDLHYTSLLFHYFSLYRGFLQTSLLDKFNIIKSDSIRQRSAAQRHYTMMEEGQMVAVIEQ